MGARSRRKGQPDAGGAGEGGRERVVRDPRGGGRRRYRIGAFEGFSIAYWTVGPVVLWVAQAMEVWTGEPMHLFLLMGLLWLPLGGLVGLIAQRIRAAVAARNWRKSFDALAREVEAAVAARDGGEFPAMGVSGPESAERGSEGNREPRTADSCARAVSGAPTRE